MAKSGKMEKNTQANDEKLSRTKSQQPKIRMKKLGIVKIQGSKRIDGKNVG